MRLTEQMGTSRSLGTLDQSCCDGLAPAIPHKSILVQQIISMHHNTCRGRLPRWRNAVLEIPWKQRNLKEALSSSYLHMTTTTRHLQLFHVQLPPLHEGFSAPKLGARSVNSIRCYVCKYDSIKGHMCIYWKSFLSRTTLYGEIYKTSGQALDGSANTSAAVFGYCISSGQSLSRMMIVKLTAASVCRSTHDWKLQNSLIEQARSDSMDKISLISTEQCRHSNRCNFRLNFKRLM